MRSQLMRLGGWSACHVARTAAILVLCSTAFAQLEPIPDPVPMMDSVRVGGAVQSGAQGKTLYRITGLTEPQVIDGWLIAGADSGATQKEPFGYVTIEAGNASKIEIEVTDEKRRQVLAEKFGDGWRIMTVGPVWCEFDVYRTLIIDDKPFEFLAERQKLQFLIEGYPPPDPDDPAPPPDNPSPFSRIGLQVLIVYDSDQIMPVDQAEVLYGKRMLDWLDANCLKIDGAAARRVLDKDATGEGEFVQALQLPRESLPWLIVGNGKSGFSGPLPPTVDATISLLERFK